MLLSRVLSDVQECTTSALYDVSAAVQGSRGNRESTDGHPQVGGRPGEEAAGGEAAQPAQARQPLQGDPPHAAQPQRLQCRVPPRVEQHPLRGPAGPRGLQRSFPDSDPYLWSQNPGEEMQGSTRGVVCVILVTVSLPTHLSQMCICETGWLSEKGYAANRLHTDRTTAWNMKQGIGLAPDRTPLHGFRTHHPCFLSICLKHIKDRNEAKSNV